MSVFPRKRRNSVPDKIEPQQCTRAENHDGPCNGWPCQSALLRARDFGPPATGEVRVVNEATGGEKGQKLARFDLIPAHPLWLLAEHYGRGARKYADRNWERGYDWSLSFQAMQRHAWLYWQGEDIDPETGSPHLVAVAWHAFALLEYARTHPDLDNRPKVNNVQEAR